MYPTQIIISSFYQIADDDDEDAPLTIDESIVDDEQSHEQLRFPNQLSLQQTALSLLGLASNGNR